MQCPKCNLVEMRVDKSDETNLYFICKKCGTTKEVSIEELNQSVNQDE